MSEAHLKSVDVVNHKNKLRCYYQDFLVREKENPLVFDTVYRRTKTLHESEFLCKTTTWAIRQEQYGLKGNRKN
jgi:hypothetical protein